MSDDSSYEPSFDTCDSVSPACPVETTLYGDYFTLGACIVFIVWYGIALLLQVPFAWKSKAWSYAACLFVGTAFEFLGYIGRAIMSDNPWNCKICSFRSGWRGADFRLFVHRLCLSSSAFVSHSGAKLHRRCYGGHLQAHRPPKRSRTLYLSVLIFSLLLPVSHNLISES